MLLSFYHVTIISNSWFCVVKRLFSELCFCHLNLLNHWDAWYKACGVCPLSVMLINDAIYERINILVVIELTL